MGTPGGRAFVVVSRFNEDVTRRLLDGALGALTTLFISRLFEKKNIGGSAGMLASIQILGQMVGALVFSPLGFRYGLQYPFLICGGLIIVNSFYGALIFRRLEY